MKTTDFIKESQIADDAHVMHVDHEIQMAREECYHSAANAIKLHRLLKQVSEQEGIDAWASEKITLANDYLRTVCEWLEYELMSKNSQSEMAIPAAFDEESAEQMIARALSETTEVSKKNQQNLDKNPWAGIGFDVRSDYLWPAMMFESTKEGSEFSQWIGNYKQHLSSPKDNAKCILAMANKMSDKIIIFYGIAEYVGEDSNSYVLKINSGTHEYSKNNQLVFASSKDFEHFKTTLALKFGEIPIKTKKMPVMEKSEDVAENSEEPVGFHVDTELAYQAVMRKFGDVVSQDPESGTMYVPAQLWTQVEQVAFDADGRGAERAEGVMEGLPQTLRKVVPGYAKREIDKKMDAEKFGRTDVDRDANYWRYKKIQDKIKNKGVAESFTNDVDTVKHRIAVAQEMLDNPKTSFEMRQIASSMLAQYRRQLSQYKDTEARYKGVAEEWSQKYKSSIDCSHPKGFSQKSHCAGKKKHNEDITMEVVCPDCGMCEAHGNSKIYDKCWTGFRKVPGKKRGEEGSCEKIGEDAGASSSSSVSIAAAPPQNLFKKPIKRTTKK
jgi:hypothetical protein